MAIIEVAHVSKCFHLEPDRPRSLQELVVGKFSRKPHPSGSKLFWALKDVSFQVNAGETLGIIGSNGTGKSTCLKLLARIIEPTQGTIRVDGRVSALLELGAGFHPELTGRENVFLNGSVLGMSRREMAHRFDAIVAFAELEQFIDIPVKFYSSGMYVRLAFATAINVRPDILLVDEVLAVGDQSFQDKCLERINALKQRGVTIILVSHSLDAIRNLSERALWMDEGIVQEDGVSDMVVARYLQYVHDQDEAAALATRDAERAAAPGKVATAQLATATAPAVASETVAIGDATESNGRSKHKPAQNTAGGNGDPHSDPRSDAHEEKPTAQPPAQEQPTVDPDDPMGQYRNRWGSREAEILDVRFLDQKNQERLALTTGERVTVAIRYYAHQRIEQPMFGLAIHRSDGLQINGPNNILAKYDIPYIEGEGEVHYTLDVLPLLEGTYYLTAALYDTAGTHAYDHHALMYRFRVYRGNVEERYGTVYLPARWQHVHPVIVEDART